MRKYKNPMKCHVSLVVLVGVGLGNLAKVTQLGSELGSVQLQTPTAFYYTTPASQSYNGNKSINTQVTISALILM